jgi:branched-chain amino acid transport system substrate-binding protein
VTRENVMKQAASHENLRVPLLLPGIMVSTGPTDFYPIQSVQLERFKGETWDLFGDIMSADSA